MTSDDIAKTILLLPEPVRSKYLKGYWEIGELQGTAFFWMPQETFDALPKRGVIKYNDEQEGLRVPARTLMEMMER